MVNKNSLVVYRQDKFLWSGMRYPIDVNGKPACTLLNGGFMVIDKPSIANLSASSWDMPGTSRHTVSKNARYVRIQPRDAVAVGAMLGGLGGMLAAEGGEASGPFEFIEVNDSQAKQELIGLNREC